MPQKGDEIRFVKGSYAGCVGWVNTSKRSKKKSSYVHVIVKTEGNIEKATRVKRNSIRQTFEDPTSFEEAALQQHADLELALIRVTEIFAECGINQTIEAIRLFEEELDRSRAFQISLGNKARYRHIEWTEPEVDDDMGNDANQSL